MAESNVAQLLAMYDNLVRGGGEAAIATLHPNRPWIWPHQRSRPYRPSLGRVPLATRCTAMPMLTTRIPFCRMSHPATPLLRRAWRSFCKIQAGFDGERSIMR
jgi:hypothetical protein